MHDQNEYIRPSQYMLLISGFLTGSLLILAFLSSIAKQDSWIIVLVSAVAVTPLVAVYVFISRAFSGRSLMEIHDVVYGRALGRAISILYVFFFLSLLSYNVRDLSIFYSGAVTPDIPQVVIVIVTTLTCAYAAKKGMKAIARTNFIIIVLVLIVLAFTLVSLIGQMDFKNLLPLLELPAEKVAQSTIIMSLVPFGEIVLLMMVIPFVRQNKKLGKFSLGGLGIAALFYLIVSIRNITVLGASGNYFSLPSYESARMINIGEFLSRLEILIALNQTSVIFIKISILYYATVKGLAQIFNLKSHVSLILPVGAITVVYAMIAHPSEADHVQWGAKYAAFFELPFVAVLPLLTLLVMLIRKLPRKEAPR